MAQPTQKNVEPLSESPEEIVKQFTFLVKKIAYSLARRSTDPVEDLIQVGMIGLLESHKRYDPNQRAAFKTYATHFITGHIRHYLRDKQQLLRGPRALQELSYRLFTVEKKLKQEFKRDPSNHEIANALELPLENIEEVRNYQRKTRMLWLDQERSYGENDKHTLLDSVADDQGSSQNKMDTRLYLMEGIERLSETDQKLITLRYFKDLTQADIARRLDMSQMEVCRKIKQAEKKLKKLLFDYVD